MSAMVAAFGNLITIFLNWLILRNAVSEEPEIVIVEPKQPEKRIAETKPIASELTDPDDCKHLGVTDAPGTLSKRAKHKIKKSKQHEEADLVQLVEARFDEPNYLLCEGSINQEIPLQLRNKAVEEVNDIERQACDLLLL